MRLSILGSLHASHDGDDIELGGRLERRVLAALAARAPEAVSLDTLTEAVFGDEDVEGPIPRIQNHVSRLRKRLGADVVLTVHGGYRLNLERVDLDWLRFQELVTAAGSSAGEEPGTACEMLADAQSLWRGAPLADLGEWKPARSLAARMEELRCVAEDALGAALIGLGRYGEAASLLAGLVGEQPLREHRWALFMVALHRGGRQADALRAYQMVRTELINVGLEPGTELRRSEREVSGFVASPLAPRPQGGSPGYEVSSTTDAAAVNLGPSSERSPSAALPRPVTRWFGSADDRRRAGELLGSHRLVTLTGPGGAGKTRLAIEMAAAVAGDFLDGVRYLDLVPMSVQGGTVASIAAGLSAGLRDALSPIDAIVDWLRHKHLLLVLDDCDLVLGPVSDLVSSIMAAAPSVTVLATSREALNTVGERVVPVPALPGAIARELFLDRALAADGSIELATEDERAIAEICERLDGNPLAIELAAANMRSMSARDIAVRLDDRFRLLRSSARRSSDRNQSVLATIDWSYQRLNDSERSVFERASIFSGGFDLAAGVAVCSGDGIRPDDVVELMRSLVEKSMVAVDRRAGSVRYRLLETLRVFADDRLADHHDTKAVRERHLDHYLGVAERTRPLLGTRDQATGHAIFTAEWANFRTAFLRASSGGETDRAHRLLIASFRHAYQRRIQEHADWVATALSTTSDSAPFDVGMWGLAAGWAFAAGHFDRALELAKRGIDAAPAPDHPDTTFCWQVRVSSLGFRGEFEESCAAAIAGEVAAEHCDDPIVRIGFFGGHALHVGRMFRERALDLGERYRAAVRESANPSLLAGASGFLAMGILGSGDLASIPKAVPLLQDGLVLAVKVEDQKAEVELLALLALALSMAASRETPSCCHNAIKRMSDLRYWPMLGLTLEASTAFFLHTQRIRVAATLFGFLDANHPVSAFGGRSRLREELVPHVDAEPWCARGRVMDRDALVTFALRHLAGASATDADDA